MIQDGLWRPLRTARNIIGEPRTVGAWFKVSDASNGSAAREMLKWRVFFDKLPDSGEPKDATSVETSHLVNQTRCDYPRLTEFCLYAEDLEEFGNKLRLPKLTGWTGSRWRMRYRE